MKGLLAFMSHFMLFLTLATLLTALATFAAHKLKQRAKPKTQVVSASARAAAPSLVQAYDPRSKPGSQVLPTKEIKAQEIKAAEGKSRQAQLKKAKSLEVQS